MTNYNGILEFICQGAVLGEKHIFFSLPLRALAHSYLAQSGPIHYVRSACVLRKHNMLANILAISKDIAFRDTTRSDTVLQFIWSK